MNFTVDVRDLDNSNDEIRNFWANISSDEYSSAETRLIEFLAVV